MLSSGNPRQIVISSIPLSKSYATPKIFRVFFSFCWISYLSMFFEFVTKVVSAKKCHLGRFFSPIFGLWAKIVTENYLYERIFELARLVAGDRGVVGGVLQAGERYRVVLGHGRY